MRSLRFPGAFDPTEGTALSSDQRTFLLGVARSALETAVLDRAAGSRGAEGGCGPRAPSSACRRTGGAFVSLHHRNGDLRGCVGLLRSEDPLDRTVARMAVAAATQDGRFPRVSGSELRHLVIEISALSCLWRVRPEEVEAGRHGLHLRVAGSSGVLLPQVAVENGWDRERFLSKTARKAGLPEDAWRRPEAEIFVFVAEVFGEE